MNIKNIGIFVSILLMTSPLISAIGTENHWKNNVEIPIDKSDWIQLDKIISSDGTSYDEFGNSVSIDGDYAIVGAYCDNGCTGSAYIFKKEGSTWNEQAKLIPSDAESGDYAGLSVSISGDYAIIGAPVGEAAYVFIRSGSSWTQQAKLTATGGGEVDMFGWSVAISGEYAIVGGTNYDHARGAAFVFKRTSTTWNQEAKLLASDGSSDDKFGYVDINGDIAIVGAYSNDNDNGVNAGAAYIFKRETSGYWYQYSKLIASDGASEDYFGVDVSIIDDYAVIGALGDDGKKGSAYIFRYIDGVGWQQMAKLTASDGVANDRFGNSVSIYQNYVAVGAFFDDSNTGSAYIFKDDGSNWVQEAKLIASDGAADDIFGISVSIDENNIIVGARTDDNENGVDAGSAYFFLKSGAKICCDGNLAWSSVKPNSEVTGNFQISNCGEEGSLLNWELDSVPIWGVWELSPDSGTDLAYGESITIEVTVTAPPDENTEFSGKVKIINSDDPSDYCEIDVLLNTPRSTFKYSKLNLLNLIFNLLIEKSGFINHD
ncbi:MAG: hypothetical protein AYK22_03975 [Thermoplasmatales archaeon SG8-52-3]|nr:MAG: hypothetical protein AYK22_03975 [Thermoplasmatales archaeon SG8-52-3]